MSQEYKPIRYKPQRFRLQDSELIIDGFESTSRSNNGPLPFINKSGLLLLIEYQNTHRVVMSLHGELLIWLDPEYWPDNEAVIIEPITITVNKKKIIVYDLAEIGLMWSYYNNPK